MNQRIGTRILLLFLLPAALFLCGAEQAPLSPYAQAVAEIIRFDRKVLVRMKTESGGSIHRMIGYDESGFQIIADGVFVPVPGDRTDSVLKALRKKLLPLGYMAFVVERNETIKTDKIGVLKGRDQYEIVKIMHTNGNEYAISNRDVIEQLKEWEKRAPFDIIGAGNDRVEIEFTKLPKDLKLFAEEVYDFCPDAVDQGPGSAAELARDIKRTKKLFLWWD